MQQMEAVPTHHPNNLPYHSPKIFNGFAGGFGWANLQIELPDFLAEIDRWGREPVPIVIQNGTVYQPHVQTTDCAPFAGGSKSEPQRPDQSNQAHPNHH